MTPRWRHPPNSDPRSIYTGYLAWCNRLQSQASASCGKVTHRSRFKPNRCMDNNKKNNGEITVKNKTLDIKGSGRVESVWLPVLRLIMVALCRWPSTRNCGSSTALLMPTLFGPEFHLYWISLIVYPTNPAARTDKARHSRARMHVTSLGVAKADASILRGSVQQPGYPYTSLRTTGVQCSPVAHREIY